MSTSDTSTRFDSLVHVTTSGQWINGRDDASLGRLLRELDNAAVARACLVGLPGVTANAEIRASAEQARGRLVPIAGVDPTTFSDAESINREMASLGRAGFRGIKLHPRLNGYHPLHPRVIVAINAAAEHRLVIFVDTLFRQRHRATPSAPDVIDRLVHRCPRATFVLLHGGGPDVLRLAELVRLHRNLVLDVSYTLLAYKHSSIGADLRWVFQTLDQRVVIGSDMPEFTPQEAFAEAEHLAQGLPAEKWANIASGNLTRLFPDA